MTNYECGRALVCIAEVIIKTFGKEFGYEVQEPKQEPKEPLIKQEKIRKAVRAWAEANEVSQAKFDRHTSGFSASDAGNNFLSMISFDGFVFNCEDEKNYTIAELCGEEEE